MKETIKIINASILFIAIIVSAVIGCTRTTDHNKLPVGKHEYDSICTAYNSLSQEHNILYNQYDSLEFFSRKANDSLVDLCREKTKTIDSLEEELMLANYKLERIREYNRIAAQGNNITFLRGWINRVLKD